LFGGGRSTQINNLHEISAGEDLVKGKELREATRLLVRIHSGVFHLFKRESWKPSSGKLLFHEQQDGNERASERKTSNWAASASGCPRQLDYQAFPNQSDRREKIENEHTFVLRGKAWKA